MPPPHHHTTPPPQHPTTTPTQHHYPISKVELTPYLTESFGNATRIDYGTGHETNFMTWLYCLSRIGVFEVSY